MISSEQARAIALSLPEAIEQDHHGRPSFRVRGKIFATLWTAEQMNVMLDEDGIRTAVAEHPGLCSEVFWGKRLAAVRVQLPEAPPELLAELLADAWERRTGISCDTLSHKPSQQWFDERLAAAQQAPRSRFTELAADALARLPLFRLLCGFGGWAGPGLGSAAVVV